MEQEGQLCDSFKYAIPPLQHFDFSSEIANQLVYEKKGPSITFKVSLHFCIDTSALQICNIVYSGLTFYTSRKLVNTTIEQFF